MAFAAEGTHGEIGSACHWLVGEINEGMKEWRNEGMKEWRNGGMELLATFYPNGSVAFYESFEG